MNISSEYTFPIFISSTDYNLKDLRAELAHFLQDKGYRPILSSADGFPDKSPHLEPYESCLPVLEQSFVVILIIDRRYGTPFKWPGFPELIKDREVSPTHAEYLCAHTKRKRLLVFIRKELMVYYQLYRKAKNKTNTDEELAALLQPLLPNDIDIKTLQFIAEVKTTTPIPWINEFDDITSIKSEVQKKMMNELAQVFQAKDLHLHSIIDLLNTTLASLAPDEQKKALSRVSGANEIFDAAEQLENTKSELAEIKKSSREKEKLGALEQSKKNEKIAELETKIKTLEEKSNSSGLFFKDGNVQVGSITGTAFNNSLFDYSDVMFSGTYTNNQFLFKRECDMCKKSDHSTLGVVGSTFRTCPQCNRYLCESCWPAGGLFNTSSTVCPRCQSKGKISFNISE